MSEVVKRHLEDHIALAARIGVSGGVDVIEDTELNEESTSEEEQESAASPTPDADDAVIQGEDDDEDEKPPISSKLQKLIDSRGGDQDKLADSVYESWNSLSRMRKELDELKQQVQTKPVEVPKEVVEEVTLETDLPWVTEQITATDQKIAKVGGTQVQTLTDLDEARQLVSELKGELKRAEVDEKASISSQLERAQSKVERLAERWEAQNERLENLKLTKSQLSRDKTKAEREVQRLVAQRQNASIAYEQEKVEHFKEFLATVGEVGKELGVEGKALDHMAKVIRNQAIVYIRSLPEKAPAIDLEAFIKEAAQEYVDAREGIVKKGFTKFSKDKLDATTQAPTKKTTIAPTRPGTTQVSSKEKWTPEFVRQRARRMLGN